MSKLQVPESNVIKMHADRMSPIRSWKKRATLRKGIRSYTLGDSVIVNTKDENDFIEVQITGLKLIKFGNISPEIIDEEGYNNLDDLRQSLLKIYPDLTDDSYVTYVTFCRGIRL